MPKITFSVPEGVEIGIDKEVQVEGEGQWIVPSFSNADKKYRVEVLSSGDWKCSCPRWRQGNICKHISLTRATLNQKLLDILVYKHRGILSDVMIEEGTNGNQAQGKQEV